jgi:hypothetical protein
MQPCSAAVRPHHGAARKPGASRSNPEASKRAAQLENRQETGSEDLTVTSFLEGVLALSLTLFVSSLSGPYQSRPKPSERFPLAYVQKDCGPTDGPALTFYFTRKPSKEGKYDLPYLRLSIIEDLPRSAPRDYVLGAGSRVLVSRCLESGQCDSAISGTLHLSRFNSGQSASGDFEFQFKDGSLEKGSFNATWYVYRFLCG